MIHAINTADELRPTNGTEEERTRYYEQHVKPHEERVITTFPQGMTERQVFEIVLREEHWERTITGWQKHGAAIFTFAPTLIAMLNQTDVWDIPIQSIRLPYEYLYVSLPGGFLPDFNDEFEIDGMYLTSEKFLPQQLKEAFTTEAEIRADASDHLRRFGEEHMKQFYEIYKANSFNEYVHRLLENNANAQASYNKFREDPDAWYASIGKQNWSPYWMLFVDFTFRSKTRRAGSWTNEYIAREPILRADYTFPNHRSSVRDAVAESKASGLPLETFYEDAEHPNDLRNVVSSPEYLDEVTRLVFNIVCYLNWPERDEAQRLNTTKGQARVNRAHSKRKRKKVVSKALQEGFRLIHFCGYNEEQSSGFRGDTATTVATHWRRGHWRNQRHGKGFADTKLVWIAPTLVKSENNSGELVTTVYNTDSK
jgi:hypothetical protein